MAANPIGTRWTVDLLRSCSFEAKFIEIDGTLASTPGVYCRNNKSPFWPVPNDFTSWVWRNGVYPVRNGCPDPTAANFKKYSKAKCPVACSHCEDGFGPDYYEVVVAGGTGDFATMNGTYNLPSIGRCQWSTGGIYESNGFTWTALVTTFDINAGFTLLIQYVTLTGAVHFEYWNDLPLPCYGEIGGFFFVGSSGTGTIPTFTVTSVP
jgi:hypothetical protein